MTRPSFCYWRLSAIESVRTSSGVLPNTKHTADRSPMVQVVSEGVTEVQVSRDESLGFPMYVAKGDFALGLGFGGHGVSTGEGRGRAAFKREPLIELGVMGHSTVGRPHAAVLPGEVRSRG